MLDTKIDNLIEETVARQTHGIPAGLDETEPGPFLGIVLSGIDLDLLSGNDRITVLRAHQRMASHYTAETYEAMASIVTAYQDEEGSDYESAADGVAFELRAALQLTRRAADIELSLALDLRDRLPRVADALSSGLIDQRRARTIVWQTTHLDNDAARAVRDRIIGDAPHLTTGQLTSRIRELAISVDPDNALRRYEQAVADRRVVIEPTGDGTANLCAFDLPPDRAVVARQHIDRLAKRLRTSGQDRSMDQLRADVYLDLLCGAATNGRGGTVDIRVDLDTLAGLADHPGEVAGYGPVIDDITRRVIADNAGAEWRYTVTHNGQRWRPAPHGADPRSANAASLKPSTQPASSPDAGCPHPRAISIIGSSGRRATERTSTTSARSAATTMSADTNSGGPIDFFQTATSNGPAPSATPTSRATETPDPARRPTTDNRLPTQNSVPSTDRRSRPYNSLRPVRARPRVISSA
jgi:hypothetical protein